jgi:hypothetical protein
MVDRSIVSAVDIDLGVVSFVEDSAHIFYFAAVPWDFHKIEFGAPWLVMHRHCV